MSLCSLPLTDFAWLLGFPDWLAQQSTRVERGLLGDFVLQRTGYLLQDLAPRTHTESSA